MCHAVDCVCSSIFIYRHPSPRVMCGFQRPCTRRVQGMWFRVRAVLSSAKPLGTHLPSLSLILWLRSTLSLTSSEMLNTNPRNRILKIKGVNSVAQPIEQGMGIWGSFPWFDHVLFRKWQLEVWATDQILCAVPYLWLTSHQINKSLMILSAYCVLRGLSCSDLSLTHAHTCTHLRTHPWIPCASCFHSPQSTLWLCLHRPQAGLLDEPLSLVQNC